MKRFILTCLLVGGLSLLFVSCNNENENEQIYAMVDKMPEYPGGDEALMQFVNTRVRYPVKAQEEGIQGRVVTSFVVDKDGNISDIEVLEGVDPLLDEEAMRVVKEMPTWKPGEQEGKKVRVKYTLPITFRLEREAQPAEIIHEGEVYTVVEKMPEFTGGDTTLMKFLNTSLKYPEEAREKGIQGRVVVTFVVNTDGSISDATVVRGIDPGLDKEALRVIKLMPNWKPGEQKGEKVRVRYTLPIVYRLQ